MENITSKVQELADLCSSIKEDILKKARLEAEKIVNESKLEKVSLVKEIGSLIAEKKKLESTAGYIIDEARGKAGKIIDEARGKAEKIIDEAREKAEKITNNAKLEKENLKKQIQKLEAEKEKLLKKKEYLEKKINAHVKGQIVKLNVGGRIFTTTTTTLQKYGTMLSILVSGKYKNLRDKDNYIFIDRDPDLFQKGLDFLRNGFSIKNLAKGSELVCEFEYYGFNVDVIWGFNKNKKQNRGVSCSNNPILNRLNLSKWIGLGDNNKY